MATACDVLVLLRTQQRLHGQSLDMHGMAASLRCMGSLLLPCSAVCTSYLRKLTTIVFMACEVSTMANAALSTASQCLPAIPI